jgi:hypothetical protein
MLAQASTHQCGSLLDSGRRVDVGADAQEAPDLRRESPARSGAGLAGLVQCQPQRLRGFAEGQLGSVLRSAT